MKQLGRRSAVSCVLLFSTFFAAQTPKPKSDTQRSSTPKLDTTMWQKYRDEELQVEFRFPSNWKPESNDKERFKGDDGNVFVTALIGLTDAPDACKSGATHKLQPFGSNPRLQKLKIAGRNACVVWPSKDQIPSVSTYPEAMLAMEMPAPVRDKDDFYWVVEIYGDQDHILAIADTIRFLSTSKIVPPDISKFVPLQDAADERDIDLDNDGVPEVALRYVTVDHQGQYNLGLKILRYAAGNGWSEAFSEEISDVAPNFLNIWERITCANGKQGLLNTISLKGTTTVSTWYVLASVDRGFVRLVPPPARLDILKKKGLEGKLPQDVVSRGDLLIEEFVRTKNPRLNSQASDLVLNYRFTGSAIEFVSVEEQ